MKHNTFFKKLPMMIGALSIITIFLMATDCDKKDDDKKAASISLELKGAPDTTAGFVAKKTNGGVDAQGKAFATGKGKTYYTVGVPNGTKVFTFKGTTKSKGTIKYVIQQVKADKTLKTADTTLTESIVTASANDIVNGKFKFKAGVTGFFYLTAAVAAKGDYKAATTKVLLLVGAVPIPPASVVLDKDSFSRGDYAEAMGGFGSGNNVNNIVHKGRPINTGGTSRDAKKFTLKAKIDWTKFPSEAPLPAFLYELGTKGANNAAVASAVDSGTGEVTLSDSVTAANSRNITVKVTASPYVLAAKDLYLIIIP